MFQIFLKTLAIFIIIGFGFALRRRQRIDADFNRMLASVLIHVFYPALILSSLIRNYSVTEIVTLWPLPVGAFMLMLTGWAIGLGLSRFLRLPAGGTREMFHFQSSMNNYSFLPIMLASMLWVGPAREQAIAGIVYAALGAEIFIWTLGIQTITGKLRPSFSNLRNLLSMPILAMGTAFLIIFIRDVFIPANVVFPEATTATAAMLLDTLELTGGATIPISGIIVGARMAGLHPAHLVTPKAGLITVIRLAVIPAVAIPLFLVLPLPAAGFRILFLIALMPCALTSVTLAEVYRADADFAAASVMTTHLACLITLPLWLRFLQIA